MAIENPHDLLIECTDCGVENMFSEYSPEDVTICNQCRTQLIQPDFDQTHNEYRYYNRKTSTRVWHSAPYAAEDVAYFDGFGGARVYIIPSRELVIVRTGSIAPSWDDAYLVNTIIQGL